MLVLRLTITNTLSIHMDGVTADPLLAFGTLDLFLNRPSHSDLMLTHLLNALSFSSEKLPDFDLHLV